MSVERDVAAILVAAGRGERAGGGAPKQFREWAGSTAFERAALTLARHPAVDDLVVVVSADGEETARALLARSSVNAVLVHGGATRAASVRAGLAAVPERTAKVLVHDAARPLAPARLVSDGLAALDGAQAAVPALPVVDTLKRVDAAGAILETPERAALRRAQTPQAFDRAFLAQAFDKFGERAETFTDEAALVAAAGGRAVVFPGDDKAMKITTAADFDSAARLLGGEMAGDGVMTETRTGVGFDVHAFAPGDHVMLCGLAIPHNRGLKGHSDADVALHTVTDALLGAIGEGDIGRHFPPSDPQWKGADSTIFLREAAAMAARAGGRIVNVDLTIIGEEPKIGPHRDALRRSLAEILGVSERRVNVKATTTERLGFPGRGEGLAALASCSVAMPSLD